MPTFFDLNEVWEEFATDAIAEGSDCTILASEGPMPFNVCQKNCSKNLYNAWPATTLCNAFNYNYLPIDPNAPLPNDARCEYLSCIDNPPGTQPSPGWILWTYNRGTAVTQDLVSGNFNGIEINSSAPCTGSTNGSFPLVPRDNAYDVAVINVAGTGRDRVLIVGGDAKEANIYYSDDGGRSFQCYDGPQIFSPRGFTVIMQPKGILPGNPALLLGGEVEEVTNSIGMFVNVGDGTTGWVRPTCTPGSCAGQCEDPNTYCLPGAPVLPGQVAYDWSTLYLWLEGPSNPTLPVFYLNSSNYNVGWLPLTGASGTGAMGRRVFIKGPAPGSGCFFSTDYTAARLWIDGTKDAYSNNSFATARTPYGPWVPGVGPWTARGSAVVTTSEDQTKIWFGGGFNFEDGYVERPTQGDLWTVDVTVCLLGANGVQCTDPSHVSGPPDLNNVLCSCLPQWQGDDRCGSCTLGSWGPTCTGTCPSGNGFCNSGNGWGVCDPVNGCTCTGNHVQGPAMTCDACTAGYATPDCSPCAPCDPTGGYCDGDGMPVGTGQCICNAGFTGPTCSDVVQSQSATKTVFPKPPSYTSSPAPAAPTASAGLSSGAAAAVSVVVIGVAIGGGFFVWSTFFGGGPAIAAAFASVKAALPSASAFGGNAAGSERSGLLAAKAGPLSPQAAQARFASTPNTGTKGDPSSFA